MGALLRRGGGPPHRCSPPFEGVYNDVWQCGCRRRWTCLKGDVVLDIPDDFKGPGFKPFHQRASWERRYWPWPRTAD